MADVFLNANLSSKVVQRFVDTGLTDSGGSGLPIVMPLVACYAAKSDGTPGPDGTVANPKSVTMAASVGSDASANRPALPSVGANFGGTGPYANYVLIKTVAASNTRRNIQIDNLTGAQIAIVRDDGTAASSAPPVNASVFALAGGAGAGQQGGSYSSNTFLGRLQIYAPGALSGSAYVNIMQE